MRKRQISYLSILYIQKHPKTINLFLDVSYLGLSVKICLNLLALATKQPYNLF